MLSIDEHSISLLKCLVHSAFAFEVSKRVYSIALFEASDHVSVYPVWVYSALLGCGTFGIVKLASGIILLILQDGTAFCVYTDLNATPM